MISPEMIRHNSVESPVSSPLCRNVSNLQSITQEHLVEAALGNKASVKENSTYLETAIQAECYKKVVILDD